MGMLLISQVALLNFALPRVRLSVALVYIGSEVTELCGLEILPHQLLLKLYIWWHIPHVVHIILMSMLGVEIGWGGLGWLIHLVGMVRLSHGHCRLTANYPHHFVIWNSTSIVHMLRSINRVSSHYGCGHARLYCLHKATNRWRWSRVILPVKWHWSKTTVDLREKRVLSAFAVRCQQMALAWQHLIQKSIKPLLASCLIIY